MEITFLVIQGLFSVILLSTHCSFAPGSRFLSPCEYLSLLFLFLVLFLTIEFLPAYFGSLCISVLYVPSLSPFPYLFLYPSLKLHLVVIMFVCHSTGIIFHKSIMFCFASSFPLASQASLYSFFSFVSSFQSFLLFWLLSLVLRRPSSLRVLLVWKHY